MGGGAICHPSSARRGPWAHPLNGVPHGRPSILRCVKVILPDASELELPDGATGLDAARAIGPKLAEQAVLVKADGEPQDLRLPLPDGTHLQILTTRDTADPDALAVLRHSSAHLLAEAVRRLYPGVKVAIGMIIILQPPPRSRPPLTSGQVDFDFH